MNVLAALWAILGFCLAAWLSWPAIRRSALGVAHPAVAFVVLEAIFFGIGSIALAIVDGIPGPAWFLGGAMLAFGAGVRGSSVLASQRSDAGPGASAARPSDPEPERGIRRFMPLVLALAALGALATIVVRAGVPFLSSDITGARGELVGLPIQLVRVCLPGLAIVWLFDWLRLRGSDAGGDPAIARRLPTAWLRLAGVGVLLALSILLASRYLAAELLAALVLAWLIAGRPLPLRWLVVGAGLALVAFVAIGVIRAYDRAQGQEIAFAAERTISRVVLIQPRTLAALQAVIPAEQPFFDGLTWLRRLGPAIGRPDIPNLGYWIYPRVVQDAASQTTSGYAAPGLLGEAWANFGPLGVAIFAMLGVAVERSGAWLAVHRTRLVDVAAGSLGVLFVARTHALGLGGLAILVVILVGWRLLTGGVVGLGGQLRATLSYRPAAD